MHDKKARVPAAVRRAGQPTAPPRPQNMRTRSPQQRQRGGAKRAGRGR